MILLTGGTGFLGSHIAYELVSKGENIRALKRKNATTALTEKIFSFYSSDPKPLLAKIEWVEGDVLDLGSLEDAMQGVTQVYHSAAIVSFNPKEKEKMLQVNIDGTANIVNTAMHAGVKKFCYISSIATLGFTTDGKLIDEDVWWKNDPSNSWYAISKYGAEREVWRAAEESLTENPDGEAMSVVIVNPAFILGPGDESRTSTEVFGALRKGNSWYTLGENGYVDVRDVAAAAVKLMKSDIRNQRFILSAVNLSYRDFFDKILVAFDKPKTKRRAGKFSLALGWRGEKILTALNGENPRVTKETALTALQVNRYDGSRITKTIDFNYRDCDKTIEETISFYKQ
ncbi:MAG: NAD-dependent epimerase/dehydratase family protein [Bacteroidota bacterium]|nr:NAD-dependent epimerase/dehydratase family protein [Bacteroidota bacterium]